MARPRIQSNEEVLQTAVREDGKVRIRVVFEACLPRVDIPGTEPPPPPPKAPARPREDLRIGDTFVGPLGTYRVRRFSPPNNLGTNYVFYQWRSADGTKERPAKQPRGCFMKMIDGAKRIDPEPPAPPPPRELKVKKHAYRELRHQAFRFLDIRSPGMAWQAVRFIQLCGEKFPEFIATGTMTVTKEDLEEFARKAERKR